MEMHANEIVAGGGHGDFLEDIASGAEPADPVAEAVKEVGEQKDNGAAADDVVQEGQRRRDVGAFGFGLEKEHFLDEAQYVAAALARRQEQFDLVGEEKEADLVTAAGGGGGKRGGDLDGRFALAAARGAERAGGGD